MKTTLSSASALRGLNLLCALALAGGSLLAADAPVPAPVAAPAGQPAAPAPAPGPGLAARGGRGGRGGGPAIPPGPPAPVPAEVAIPRPSPAELTQLNDALKKFVATDTSPAKPLLLKYQSMLTVQAPRANTAIAPSLNPGYMAKHTRNLEEAKQGDVDILFMGDSITDNLHGGEHKPVFDQYFGTLKTANFGIGGDTTQGVLWRLMNGEGQGFQPKVIQLMIGTNNSGSNTSAEIAEGVGAIVLEMRKDFPAAKILLLGIFPRATPGSAARNTVLGANAIIAKLDDRQHVFYLDIGAKFLDANGMIPSDVMADSPPLHPTAKGDTLWFEAVKEPLANLLKGVAP